MKKAFVAVAAIGALVVAAGSAQMKSAEFRYADVAGKDGVKGTMVFVTLPSGEHNVFVHLSGLKANAKVYANHIHWNAAGDANCAAQNGDKVVPLTSLMADANGEATAFTKLAASVKYPAGRTYYNVHSNTPDEVGPSIGCGEVMK